MQRIIKGFILALVLVFVLRYCEFRKEERQTVVENTQLIQQQIKNVGKLIVTEGHYAEAYTYEDQKEYFGDYISFEKKALVVVNAHVTVSYDLEQLEYDIEEDTKTLRISNIPEEELQINPTLKFYDINDSYFNPFTEEDYNNIQERVRKQLREKLVASALKSNARNRLISELSKLYILTNSMGWTIVMDAPQDFPEINTFEEQENVLHSNSLD